MSTSLKKNSKDSQIAAAPEIKQEQAAPEIKQEPHGDQAAQDFIKKEFGDPNAVPQSEDEFYNPNTGLLVSDTLKDDWTEDKIKSNAESADSLLKRFWAGEIGSNGLVNALNGMYTQTSLILSPDILSRIVPSKYNRVRSPETIDRFIQLIEADEINDSSPNITLTVYQEIFFIALSGNHRVMAGKKCNRFGKAVNVRILSKHFLALDENIIHIYINCCNCANKSGTTETITKLRSFPLIRQKLENENITASAEERVNFFSKMTETISSNTEIDVILRAAACIAQHNLTILVNVPRGIPPCVQIRCLRSISPVLTTFEASYAELVSKHGAKADNADDDDHDGNPAKKAKMKSRKIRAKAAAKSKSASSSSEELNLDDSLISEDPSCILVMPTEAEVRNFKNLLVYNLLKSNKPVEIWYRVSMETVLPHWASIMIPPQLEEVTKLQYDCKDILKLYSVVAPSVKFNSWAPRLNESVKAINERGEVLDNLFLVTARNQNKDFVVTHNNKSGTRDINHLIPTRPDVFPITKSVKTGSKFEDIKYYISAENYKLNSKKKEITLTVNCEKHVSIRFPNLELKTKDDDVVADHVDVPAMDESFDFA